QSLLPLGDKDAKSGKHGAPQTIFATYSGGVKTNRDETLYDFEREALLRRVEAFIDAYLAELDRYRRARKRQDEIDIDAFVDYVHLKWDSTLKQHLARGRETEFDPSRARRSLYRPFCKQWLYFDRLLINSVCRQPYFFPTPAAEAENRAICLSGVASSKPFQALMVNVLPNLDLLEKTQCFPLYVYAEDGGERRENITDWALERFRAHYRDARIGKADIFYYIYAVLHQPAYRERFAEALKKELPRIPLAADFWAYAEVGRRLGDLHVGYESAPEYPLREVWARGKAPSYRIESAMRLESAANGEYALVVNKALRLEGIPSEALGYKLGNRAALEWLIDQYRVKSERDPNAYGDERYVVSLVKRVVWVSLQTLQSVAGLPDPLAVVPNQA
ncbi:MAG: type ISP restriction/modification enzyme, partial [Aggregatilineales bacterium]